MTMRSFLNILNELKMLDGKLLSAKKVVQVMSSDNPIVFDSDNSFNLDLEMSFLEFFETLIGCALIYDDKNKLIKSRPVTSKLAANSEPEIVDYVSEINERKYENEEEKNQEQNLDTQMEKKEEQDIEKDANLEKIEELNLNNKALSERTNKFEDEDSDFEMWIEKNSFFFNQVFFPNAEKYNEITKLINISL